MEKAAHEWRKKSKNEKEIYRLTTVKILMIEPT